VGYVNPLEGSNPGGENGVMGATQNHEKKPGFAGSGC